MKTSSLRQDLSIETACDKLAQAMIAVALHPECPPLIKEQVGVFYSAVEPEMDQAAGERVRLTHLLPEALRGACSDAARARHREPQQPSA